jgi:hypothetical protein
MTNDELRQLAEAATPGPWCNMKDTVFHGEIRQANDEGFALIAVMPELDDREEDFDYIAAMNPERAIELLDEVDRLRERLSLIYGLTFDRDGRATVEGLGELVDEVCRIAQGQYTFEPGTPPESEG